MPVIRVLEPTRAIPAIWGLPPHGGMTRGRWEAYCERQGFLAFAAVEGREGVGYAIAESHPTVVHVLDLEGDAAACRLLLDRLVRLAGERHMSGRFPADRPDLLALLDAAGFVRRFRDEFQGRPTFFCEWRRDGEGE